MIPLQRFRIEADLHRLQPPCCWPPNSRCRVVRGDSCAIRNEEVKKECVSGLFLTILFSTVKNRSLTPLSHLRKLAGDVYFYPFRTIHADKAHGACEVIRPPGGNYN